MTRPWAFFIPGCEKRDPGFFSSPGCAKRDPGLRYATPSESLDGHRGRFIFPVVFPYSEGVKQRSPGSHYAHPGLFTRHPNPIHQTLDVVVQGKLMGMRSHADRVGLVFAFVADPGLNHVRRKHFTLQQELMVLFQAGEGLVQRGRGSTTTKLRRCHVACRFQDRR